MAMNDEVIKFLKSIATDRLLFELKETENSLVICSVPDCQGYISANEPKENISHSQKCPVKIARDLLLKSEA